MKGDGQFQVYLLYHHYVIKINMFYIVSKKKYREVVIWWGPMDCPFTLLKAAVAAGCRSQ